MSDIFEFIKKNHTSYEQLPISGRGGPYNKIWHLTLPPPQKKKIMKPNEFKKLLHHLQFLKQKKNLGPIELVLQVMQNIYSPNRFYLSSPQKSIYKEMIFSLLYRSMIFPFLVEFNLFFLCV